MSDKNKNNEALIIGTIATEFKYSHSAFGEKFYTAKIETSRSSGAVDAVIITASERFVDVQRLWQGARVGIHGQFRSHRVQKEGKSHLSLVFFVKELRECNFDDMNKLILNGNICKKPVYRKTPLGRNIADIFLAVNREYGKSDYIPCIAWGRNARFAGSLEVGTRLQIEGRIQSREYQKRISDDKYETRTAYEVSVSKLTVVEEMER